MKFYVSGYLFVASIDSDVSVVEFKVITMVMEIYWQASHLLYVQNILFRVYLVCR